MDPWNRQQRPGCPQPQPFRPAHGLALAPGASSSTSSSGGSGYKLGTGGVSVHEARMAQEKMNSCQVARHKQLEWEKRYKKLEEKLARDPDLNARTCPGRKLGQSDLSIEQIRELQDQRNAESVTEHKLKRMKEQHLSLEPRKHSDEINHDKAMREMRMKQQQKYNAAMKTKPPAMLGS